MKLGSLALALALLASIAVTALATAGASASNPPQTDPALARFYEQKRAWKACGKGFECAKAMVPVDYAKPGGRR